MRPRQYVVVGVGVLIAAADAALGMAQPIPQPSMLPEKAIRLQLVGKPSPMDAPAIARSRSTARPAATEMVQPIEHDSVTANSVTANSVPANSVTVKTAPVQVESGTAEDSETAETAPVQVVKPAERNSKTTQPAPTRAVPPVAQTPETTQPPPVTAPLPTTVPAPAAPSFTPLPDLAPSPTPSPAKAGPAPAYLNPNPNPLQFPTRPEEVRLRGVQPITLQQAIELAIRNNRSLQVVKLQESNNAVREAEAELFPTLSVQANVTRSESASASLQIREQEEQQQQLPDFLQRQLGTALNRGFNATANLNYNIFTSGGRPARIRAAREQLRSDQLQTEITREQLILDVSSDYYDLQEADENVRIRLASVRNAEASLRDTQALERAGLGTRFDVLRAEVQLANEVQSLTNARAAQFQRRRQLVQRLSLPAWVDLAAADPVLEAGAWTLPLDETIVLALRCRAELPQQLSQREVSEQQRRAALSALGPTLSVTAQYQLQEDFTDTFRPGDGYSVGAGLQWDLFDGGLAIARARRAESNMRIAETRFADASNQIRQQVETAYSNLRSNFENIATTRRAVEQAREALRLARLRFQAGVGTQTDVINAENDLTRAEGNAVTAIIGYNRAFASLRRAISNLSTTGIPIANLPTDGRCGATSASTPAGTQ